MGKTAFNLSSTKGDDLRPRADGHLPAGNVRAAGRASPWIRALFCCCALFCWYAIWGSTSARAQAPLSNLASRAADAVLEPLYLAGTRIEGNSAPPPGGVSLWMVSAFPAPICDGYDPSRLAYYRYVDCCWRPSTLKALLAEDDPRVTTSIFVYGYLPYRDMDEEKAIEKNTEAVLKLMAHAEPPCRPIRMIVYSWNGNRPPECSMSDGARVAFATADRYGYYLAWLIDQLNPQVQVGMLSYSFGAPVVLSATHVLAGGTVPASRPLARLHPDRPAPSLAMLGSAVDNDWVLPGHHLGRALDGVGLLLLSVNPDERVLQYFTNHEIGGGGTALGLYGLVNREQLGANVDKVSEICVTPYNDHKHFFKHYMASCEITEAVKPYLYPEPAALPREQTTTAPATKAAPRAAQKSSTPATSRRPGEMRLPMPSR